MASSRKSKRSSTRATDLAAHVAAELQSVVQPGQRVLIGLSGGVDSIVLLDVLVRLRSRTDLDLRALHVNHGLSPNAAAWARFCRETCATYDVACSVKRVEVPRGNSTERAARESRYAALKSVRSDVIALAHNADDQAETVLLQLLRGAGVKGLSAMPRVKKGSPAIVRPLLQIPRAEIEAYARAGDLRWTEDESNESVEYLRNWLRLEIMPRLAARVPAYRETFARAARHCADAAELLEDLAHIDRAREATTVLDVTAVRALSGARARNLLRHAIAKGGWRMPDTQRLDEALRQALSARTDARIEVDLGECTLRRRGDALHLVEHRVAAISELSVPWSGEDELMLPALHGVLAMPHGRGDGLSLSRLTAAPVTIRSRRGGERLRPGAARPTRTVKNLLQEAGVVAWERDRLPFIYCGETLACIPGLAIDERFQAREGEESIVPEWRPAAAATRA